MGVHVALSIAGGEGITPTRERPAQRISPRDSLSLAWPRPEFHILNLAVFCAFPVGKGGRWGNVVAPQQGEAPCGRSPRSAPH